MGVLRGREDAVIVLRDQSYAMTLEPRVGITVVEGLEEALHQTVPTGIDLREIAHGGKGVGAVAAAAT